MAFKDIGSSCFSTALFLFALVETFLATGVIFGWANMIYIFKFEKFYLHLCPWYDNEPNITDTSNQSYQVNTTGSEEFPYCPSQDKIFSLIFTISAQCFGVAMLPGGVLIDKQGPFIVGSVCGLCYMIGALMLSFTDIGREGLLFPAFILISLAGNVHVGCLFKVCSVAFRKRKSLVLCILNGILDSSSVVFLVFKLMYDGGVGFQQIAWQYAGVCFVVIIAGLVFFIPPQAKLQQWIAYNEEQELEGNIYCIHTEDEINVGVNLGIQNLGASSSRENIADREIQHDSRIRNEGRDTHLGSDTNKANAGVCKLICSPQYILQLVFLCTITLKLFYFVGSLENQLDHLSNSNHETVSWYINIFGYIQLGGCLVTPLLGLLFEHDISRSPDQQPEIRERGNRHRKTKKCITPTVVTVILSVLFCVLGLFKNISLQIPQYVLYTVVRGFLYANYSACIAVTFPNQYFGTLLGFGYFCGSLFGLSNYGFFELTMGPFEGDSTYTNVVLLVLVCCSATYPLNMWLEIKR